MAYGPRSTQWIVISRFNCLDFGLEELNSLLPRFLSPSRAPDLAVPMEIYKHQVHPP